MISSNEYVAIGHPDSVADALSSYILNQYLKHDRFTRYAVECQIKDQHVTIAGEVTSQIVFSDDTIKGFVKEAIEKIGYTHEYALKWPEGSTLDASKVEVDIFIGQQSPDIAQGVNNNGWGDQGVFCGMAVNDMDHECMPIDRYYSNVIGKTLYKSAVEGILPIGLDIKTLVTVDDDFVEEVVVAAPMLKENEEKAREGIKKAICDIIPKIKGPSNIIINGTGSYVVHSSVGDSGTTGRKLAVNFYGLSCPIGGGCVDGDTEYLTPNGWKRIEEYDGGVVGQVDTGMNLTFVKPLDYIKTFHKDVYEIKTKHTLDMVLSGNHNVFYKTSKGNYIKKSVDDILKLSNKSTRGHHAEIPRFFYYGFNDKDTFDNDYLVRFIVAHCADGTKLNNSNYNGRIRVKKQHKIDLLREYLPKTGIRWEERSYNDGFAYFYYKMVDNNKLLSHHFNKISMHTAKIICEEVFKWDGSEEYKEFRTTQKIDADFVQFVLSGMYGNPWSLITSKIHKGAKSIVYVVRNNTHMFSCPFRKSSNNVQTKLKPMTMYCFTVPSGLLLMRRKNYIFVTGNSPWTKDPTKADLTLNLACRYFALKKVLEDKNLKTCYVKMSCCIGKPNVRISYFNENWNCIGDENKVIIPNDIIEHLKLRDTDYFNLCRDGLFSSVDSIALGE